MNTRVEGKQKRAHATREHILSSFAQLMSRKGYDQISIAEIALHAEVGKGTVLAHFSEKLTLAGLLFGQQFDACRTQIAKMPPPENAHELRKLFEPLLVFAFQDDVYIRLIVGEGKNICRQIIEPAELALFEQLAEKLVHTDPNRLELNLTALRAFLLHAAVMFRACDAGVGVIDEFEQLIDQYIFNAG